MSTGSPCARWPWALALLVVLVAAGALRFGSLGHGYSHPDEVIGVRLADRVLRERTLDTNWKNADLPAHFRYPQYNFSGYALFSAAALAAAGAPADENALLARLRWLSAALGVLLVAQTFVVGRMLFGRAAALAAAALGAVALLLYQDSLYARPETFVTALALLYLQVLLSPRLRRVPRVAIASLILGFLAGTKLSLLALAPLLLLDGRTAPAPVAWSGWLRQEWQRRRSVLLAALQWALPCCIAGFALAAPHALLNPGDYLEGMRALMAQYDQGHWPHGLPQGSAPERLWYAARYFGATLGLPLLAAAAVGIAFALRDRDGDAVLLFIVAAVTAWRFGSYATFFERNFSHVLPILLLFAGHGIAASARLAKAPASAQGAFALLLLAVAAVPAARATATLRFQELGGRQEALLQFERRRLATEFGLPVQSLGWAHGYEDTRRPVPPCGRFLLELSHAGEQVSEARVRRLVEREGFRVVRQLSSPFAHVPPSTLQTYFSPGKVFLLREDDSRTCTGPARP